MNAHYLLIAVALFVLGLALSGCSVRWGGTHPMAEHVNRVTLEMPDKAMRSGK